MWLAAVEINVAETIAALAGLIVAVEASRRGVKHVRRARAVRSPPLNGSATIRGLVEENDRLRARLSEIEPRVWYAVENEQIIESLRRENAELKRRLRARGSSARRS